MCAAALSCIQGCKEQRVRSAIDSPGSYDACPTAWKENSTGVHASSGFPRSNAECVERTRYVARLVLHILEKRMGEPMGT